MIHLMMRDLLMNF